MLKLPRRKFLRLAAGGAALPVLPRVALALDYPTRPVHIIVGFAAGLAPDIVARLISQWLSERLGNQFVVENRPGAGSNIGTEAVVRAPADGYTLLLVSAGNTINATLYPNLNFNFVQDIMPVASIGGVPFVLAVNPSLPAQTIPEFIAYAKANPGKINMASGGNGTAPHVFGELFRMMTGINLVHVPYSSNYLPDVLAGQVQVVFNPVPQAIAYIRSEKLRALGVTTPKRLEVLPDTPAINEFVPGYEASGWLGVGCPKGTSPDIIDRLNMQINAGLADAELKARLSHLGVIPNPMTPADFDKLIVAETAKWAKVVKFAGL